MRQLEHSKALVSLYGNFTSATDIYMPVPLLVCRHNGALRGRVDRRPALQGRALGVEVDALDSDGQPQAHFLALAAGAAVARDLAERGRRDVVALADQVVAVPQVLAWRTPVAVCDRSWRG
jgi:hypothetical protein